MSKGIRILNRIKRAFTVNSLQKRLLIPILLTSMLLGLTTVYNVMSINSIVNRINETYQSNADLFELGQVIAKVEEHTESYLSTRSSTALENYYKERENLMKSMDILNDEIIDSEAGLLELNIRNMIMSWLDETEQAISAKRGRNIEQYISHFDEARIIYGYINDYISRLNTVQFQQNYDNYHNMGRVLNTVELLDLIIVAVVLITNTMIVLVTTLRITRPVVQLAHQAEEVARGNLEVEEVFVGTKDELSILAKSFHGMVLSLREYVVQIRENTIKESRHKQQELTMQNYLQEARLKNMQAQINPHFLFNALNAGAQLAMIEGADRTTELVENIADFYRYNIKIFDYDATLKNEIEMVRHYIYIQKVRFADRFDYTQEIDESCLNIRMPSLILQPIVENAFAHGLKDVEQGGLISIKVERDEEHVIVCISDNGAGFKSETISLLMQAGPEELVVSENHREKELVSDKRRNLDSINKEYGAGIALSNVINRLKLFYRQEQIMQIKSGGKIKGSQIYLRIPLNENNIRSFSEKNQKAE